MVKTEVPPATWAWLDTLHRFPAHRLESRAELLVLLAAAAEGAGESGVVSGGANRVVRQDARQMASQRQQGGEPPQTHFKSNNRTKV